VAVGKAAALLCTLQPSEGVLSDVKSIGTKDQGCQVRGHNLEGEEKKRKSD